VSKFEKMNQLIIVVPGVKINGTHCRDMLLTEQLLPVMCEISGKFFIFQYDSAVLLHTELLEWETPAFISPHLWLPTVQI